MATELGAGVFRAIFQQLSRKAMVAAPAGLTSLALAIEREAKDSLRRNTHTRGTPTTAAAGGPPALVSGTLRRSITHSKTPELIAGGFEIRVGTAVGFYPPYPKRGKRTMSSRYGYYLETGLRNGSRYPFLKPAFDKVVGSGDVGRWVAAEWKQVT